MDVSEITRFSYEPLADHSTNCISPEDFQTICRTCLGEGEIKSIFEQVRYEKPVNELLQLYAALEVHQEDCLPQNICEICLEEICRFHLFVEKCQRSNTFLRYVIDLDLNNKIKEECAIIQPPDVSIKSDFPDNNSCEEDKVRSSDDSDSKEYLETERKMLRTRRFRKSMQGPPFHCKDCGENFSSYELLQQHRKERRHRNAKKHACSICSKAFTSSKLRDHMRAHTKEQPYQCEVCSQRFSMSGNLRRHMMTHTGERPHVCEVCGKGFIQATSLHSHRKTHATCENIDVDANSPHFICKCGRGFKRLARYNAHLKKHEAKSEELKKQPIQDDQPREHICMICKRAYKSKHLLKAHQLTHGEKAFLCSDCGKSFVTKAALQSHLKVHTGEKPHTCNVCKKSFAHVGSFEAHMLIHTGQKPYNCKICTKAFTQRSHLKYHLRTHSGERPYMCSFCGKRFALKGNLTVHVRTHTGETPYICPVCGKGFYDSSSMKKHKKGHGETVVVPLQVGTLSVGSIEIINSTNCVDFDTLIT